MIGEFCKKIVGGLGGHLFQTQGCTKFDAITIDMRTKKSLVRRIHNPSDFIKYLSSFKLLSPLRYLKS